MLSEANLSSPKLLYMPTDASVIRLKFLLNWSSDLKASLKFKGIYNKKEQVKFSKILFTDEEKNKKDRNNIINLRIS